MAKLKIGLITSVIDNRKGKGTALMAEKFLEHLDRFSDQYEFTLIHSIKTDNPLYKKYREIIIPQSPLPFGKQILSELFFYIKCWFTGERFDLIHYMHQRIWPTYLLAPARKIVITAFDAGGMLNSLYKPTLADRVFRFTNKHLHFRMHGVIALTEYGQKEIAHYYHLPLERVFIVPLGTDKEFKPIPPTLETYSILEKKYGITRPYILSVSRFDPHKNILKLIEAYAELRKLMNAPKLVLVGGRHLPEYSQKVDTLISDLNISEHVYIAPYIHQEDLPALYAAAEVFVYPSLHEGFGLPILEAMASNTPVVISNATCLPEVAGGAAEIFDVNDSHDMARALHAVLSNKNYQQVLRAKGLERVKLFSWTKAADATIEIYKTILST